MTGVPYRLAASQDAATLGLIVLQVDQTIEQDFRRLFPIDVALHVSRVPSGADLNPDTIAEMEVALPGAAALLPPAAQFDAIGYACTSGTTLIGAARVAALIMDAASTAAVTDPLTAALAALKAVEARSISIVSPYIESVAAPIQHAFEAAGFAVPAALSFGEEIEARVARIDPHSIRAAARQAAVQGSDAIFLSCTNLRTLDIIDDLEAELGRPVLSSNQVLAWHMAQLSGTSLKPDAPGAWIKEL